jgi:hypothetical protein
MGKEFLSTLSLSCLKNDSSLTLHVPFPVDTHRASLLFQTTLPLHKDIEMVTLFFVVVELGHVSLVHIEMSESVSDLKAKIKEAKPNTVYFNAALLRVYLARDRDGKWLSSGDDEYKALKRREVPTAIQELMTDELELDSTAKLSDEAYFGTEFARGDRQINVLVKMPTDDERGETGMVCSGSFCVCPTD